MPKKKTTETPAPAEATTLAEVTVPAEPGLFRMPSPRGPAFMRVNVKVLAEDGETLLRTEVCDVYLECDCSYKESDLEAIGSSAEAARFFVWSAGLDKLITPSEGIHPEQTLKAFQRQTIRVPVPGEAVSLGEARRRDLGNEDFSPRAAKRKDDTEPQKRPKPTPNPFVPPTE